MFRFVLHTAANKSHDPLRWLSTTGTTSSLKKLLQPFVKQCHPDMAPQQGLPSTAARVNLQAIQTVNSYMDHVHQLEQGTASTTQSDSDLVEIEFVLSFRNQGKGPTTSRRKVEWKVPTNDMTFSEVHRLVQKQLLQLLRLADLPTPEFPPEDSLPPPTTTTIPTHKHYLSEDDWAESVWKSQIANAWDQSRERFLRRIHWKRFEEVYDQTFQDVQAHLSTQGMIRNHPRRRREFLARVLTNIQFRESVTPLERLVAYRRLLRVLQEHFDELHLETFGRYWEEQLSWIVTESRPYNASATAMRKRRRRQLETGYAFSIHPDQSVTVQIPVDFDTEELVEELKRNLSDFVEFVQEEDSLESLLMDPV